MDSYAASRSPRTFLLADSLRTWLESVFRDAIYAIRNLRRQPAFALTAVATLALGIGLNTSLFAFFNAFALRPWPVKDPDRVVTVFELSPSRRRADGFPLALVRHFQANAKSFSGLFAIRGTGVRAGDEQPGKRSICQLVSGNYYRVLGVDMALGRGFLDTEDRAETPEAVVVLSYATWQARFGADRGIVGRSIRLDGVPFTVVGVTAPEFSGTSPEPADFTVPMASLWLLRPGDESVAELFNSPSTCCSAVAGRLAPGVSRGQARAELAVLSRAFRSQTKLESGAIILTGTSLLSHPDAKRELQPVFALMLAGVLLILLLACANVGNLQIARAASRQREIAVRLSVGAGRARLVRQLLTEGVVIALMAGAAGVIMSIAVPGWVFRAALGAPPPFSLAPDTTVLVYALALSVAACIGFSLAPALHGTRLSLSASLKSQAALMAGRYSLRKFLLGAQVAVSVVLLVSAGLLTRSVRHAYDHDPGFSYRDVAAGAVELPANAYDSARMRTFAADLSAELEAGGGRFALTANPPFGSTPSAIVRLPEGGARQIRLASSVEVSAGYFDVLRIPVAAGRNFVPSDRNRKVILINETMARRFWPDRSPIGSSILLAEGRLHSTGGRPMSMDEAIKMLAFRDEREVIGIVKDVFTADLDRISPTFYQPLSGASAPYILMRDAPGNADRLRQIIAGLDARATIRLVPLSHRLERYLQPARVGAFIAFALGLLALGVASVGMFGVFAYSVQQRRREMGTRMVLGATPGSVVALVLTSNCRAMAVGLGLGLAAAAAASTMLERHLYGVSHLDPLAYVTATAVVLLATMAASLLPAARAARVDPMQTLRCD